MKSTKPLLVLALAASFAAAAASEMDPPLVKVPKTEAAMQATRATTAKDAANDSVKPSTHKTKAKQATKGKQAKGAPAKKHKAKAHAAK